MLGLKSSNPANNDVEDLIQFILNIEVDSKLKCEIINVAPENFSFILYSEKLMFLMANMTIISTEKVVDFSFSSIHVDPTYNITKAFVTPVTFKVVCISKGIYIFINFLRYIYFLVGSVECLSLSPMYIVHTGETENVFTAAFQALDRIFPSNSKSMSNNNIIEEE
jgi:hypothetical protein